MTKRNILELSPEQEAYCLANKLIYQVCDLDDVDVITSETGRQVEFSCPPCACPYFKEPHCVNFSCEYFAADPIKGRKCILPKMPLPDEQEYVLAEGSAANSIFSFLMGADGSDQDNQTSLTSEDKAWINENVISKVGEVHETVKEVKKQTKNTTILAMLTFLALSVAGISYVLSRKK